MDVKFGQGGLQGGAEGVEAWAVEKKVFGCVWLGGAPGAVRVLNHVEAVEVTVEACVAYPKACDGCVQGPDGGVSLPVLGGGMSVASYLLHVCLVYLYISFAVKIVS